MSKKRTRTKKLILPRRRFLQGGLASLALPSLSSSVAQAQTTTPKRMIPIAASAFRARFSFLLTEIVPDLIFFSAFF